MLAANRGGVNGFIISFMLHAVAAFALFSVVDKKPDFNQKSQESLTISLDNFIASKIAPESVKVKQEVKKQEIKKVQKPKEDVVKRVVKTEQKIEVPKQIEKQEVKENRHVEVASKKDADESTIKQEIQSVQKADKPPLHVEKKESISVEDMQAAFIKTNFAGIRDKVLKNLKYPSIAKRMRQSGIVELLLTIDTKGKLVNISVHKSSGYKLLDKSAMSAASKLCAQTLPIPQTLSRVTLPISFALN